ncbi:MAG: 30S ribosomal protein S1 [Fibrobacter sp.]|nr:30S ribosomal protein S1 [Fibrobacter sp.]
MGKSNPYIIAIDGASGTGKSTTARFVADRLGVCYIDTGAMYRAYTYKALSHKISIEDEESLLALLKETKISFNDKNEVLLDGVVCGAEIRSPEVTKAVSYYSAIPQVRTELIEVQRSIGNSRTSVLDGRDIGTTVFPQAQFKFFLTADYKVRAHRRYLEFQKMGVQTTLVEVEENLRQRDAVDSNREIAPLRRAEDAIVIDTTQLSIEEQVEQVCVHVGVVTSTQTLTSKPKINMKHKLIKGTQEDLEEILAAEEDLGNLIDLKGEALEIYGDSLEGVEEGKVVIGTIREVYDNSVLVDVSFKSEGEIARGEFKEDQEIVVGSEIEVFIEKLEDSQGNLMLSKQKADFVRVWEKIHEAFENEKIVSGTLTRRIKGGVVVDLFGIDAFLPGSQIDLRQIPDINDLIGQTFDLKVIKVNKARRNIVVSRRVVLEEERSRLRGDVLETLEKDQVRKGIVKNITDFGAFIDLGGVDGLLHITDMSYKRINHPSEMVDLGQEVEVIVLDFNDQKERISLGMKQLRPHPWKDIAERYPDGTKVSGKVVSITDYGAFVEIDTGVEGLIHVSEMSWTQHVKHPSKVLVVGQEIEAVVLKVEEDAERISLGIKQLEPDPWESIESELPPGASVSGEIRNLASFGAFVEIKEGVDGLIHVSDMSWTKKIQHPSELVKKGDRVDCVVLAVDREKRRISLSMKHLEEDPWDTIETAYSVDAEVECVIVRMLDRGVVVELDNGIEGFIHVAKLTTEYIKVPSDAFAVGDKVPAVVSEIDQPNRKLYLSVVDYFKNKESAELQEYLDKHKPTGSGNTLADAGLEPIEE